MPLLEEETLDRSALTTLQETRLSELLTTILPRNRFYADKFDHAGINAANIRTLDDWQRVPFTTKTELLQDQADHPRFGRILTYPLDNYCRYHQTSGTTGQPLRWPDTWDSWQWVLSCWKKIYTRIGVTEEDRLFFPFSFGPFLGFWSAFEAAAQIGCLCMPGGGLSSAARLRFLKENEATVILCTPTYALHLAEIAGQQGMDLTGCPVRALIVAGEPGGSIPATRQRMEEAWGARVIDHSGLTEVGPVSVECEQSPGGLHILEGDYFAEVIDPETGQRVEPGNTGEMVITNLGRAACPLLRYRTGDLVRVAPDGCTCGSGFMRLEGGILGRSDDLIHLRGNNVYPGALEQIIRGFPGVAEFQIEVDMTEAMASLCIRIEPSPDTEGTQLAAQIRETIRDRLFFRAEVVAVSSGSLPRYELKAKRLIKKT